MVKLDRTIDLDITSLRGLEFFDSYLWATRGVNDALIHKIHPITGAVEASYDISCFISQYFHDDCAVNPTTQVWAVCFRINNKVSTGTINPCNAGCASVVASPRFVKYSRSTNRFYALKATVGAAQTYEGNNASNCAEETWGYKPSFFTGFWTGLGFITLGTIDNPTDEYMVVVDNELEMGTGTEVWIRLLDITTMTQKFLPPFPFRCSSLGIADDDLYGVAVEGTQFIWLWNVVNGLCYRIDLETADGLMINEKKYNFISLTYTDTHPKERPDRFDATLEGFQGTINFGDEVIIRKEQKIVWRGLVEEIDYSAGRTVIGGRDKSVLVWKKFTNKYEVEEGSGEAPSFFDDFYPEDLFRFLLYTPIIDPYIVGGQPDLFRTGQGLGYNLITITTVPSNSGTKNNMKDRDDTTKWQSLANIANNDCIDIQLSAGTPITGIIIRSIASGFPADFLIQSATQSNYSDAVTRYTGSIASAVGTIICSFSAVSAATSPYWRIKAVGNWGYTWKIYEIFFYEGESNARNKIIGNTTARWALTLGTIDTVGTIIDGPFSIPISRLFEALNRLCEYGAESNSKREWWINLNDQINFRTRRGSNKSSTITFQFARHFLDYSYSRNIANCVNRHRQFGSDWGKDRDGYQYDWIEDAAKADSYGSYEKLARDSKLTSNDACELLSNIMLLEAKTPEEQIRLELIDDYSVGTWQVGDDVNIDCSPINLDATFRIKKKIVNIDGSGEKVNLILGESAKYRSYKDYHDRIAWIKKKILETDLRQTW